MQRHNLPLYMAGAVLAGFTAAVSFTSAPGIEPGFGLTPAQAEFTVWAVGAWLALCAVIFAGAAVACAIRGD